MNIFKKQSKYSTWKRVKKELLKEDPEFAKYYKKHRKEDKKEIDQEYKRIKTKLKKEAREKKEAEKLAQKVANARKKKKVSQATLAEMIGTKQSSISRLEKGDSLPSLDFLYKIANALGLKLKITLS